MKVGVVRTAELLRGSDVGRHAELRLRDFVAQLQSHLKRSAGRREGGAKVAPQEHSRTSRRALQDTESLRKQLLDEVLAVLRPLIGAVAKDLDLAMVFAADSPGLVFFDDGVDITSQVVAKANASRNTTGNTMIKSIDEIVERWSKQWKGDS